MNSFEVAAITPFWRWAVCPQSGMCPGIPYWSERAAREFFEEMKRELPWTSHYLVKRSIWRKTVTVVEHYEGRTV